MIRHVTVERDSTRVKTLRRLNRPGSRTVVLAWPPTSRVRPSLVWRFALIALGKSLELSTSYAGGIPLSVHFQAWAALYQIDTLVVLDAQRYSPSGLAALPEIAAAAGVDLWLIEHEPVTKDLPLLLPDHRLTNTTVEQLDTWTDSRPATQLADASAAATDTFPIVPSVTGSQFRAHTYTTVDPKMIPVVDTAFDEAYKCALAVMAEPPLAFRRERVARRWWRLLAAAHHPERAVTYARGLQAAAEEHGGWAIRVDPALIRACPQFDVSLLLSGKDWAALHRYVRTDIPAVCALTGSGVPPNTIGRLRIADVAADCAAVVDPLTGGTYAVTAPGRPFLHAHVAFRQLSGAKRTDPLFFTFTPAKGVTTARRCQQLAEQAAADVGFHSPAAWDRSIVVPDDDNLTWAASTGLTITGSP